MNRSVETAVGLSIASWLALSGGCASPPTVTPDITSVVPTTPEVLIWEALSPVRRIALLELERQPEGIDIRTELVSAVVDFYCQKAHCTEKAEEFKQKISYVSADKFVGAIQQEFENQEEKMTEDQIAESRFYLGRTMQDGNILLNTDGLSNAVATAQISKEVGEQLQGRNFALVLEKSTLLHELGHKTSTHEYLDIKDLAMGPNGTLKGLEGFTFVGSRGQDGDTFYLSGLDEAMTELANRIVSKQIGPAIAAPEYIQAMEVLAELKRHSGITDEEFLDYYWGRKPLIEFVQKYSAIKGQPPDIRTGLDLLLVVAYRQEGAIETNEAALETIEMLLEQP